MKETPFRCRWADDEPCTGTEDCAFAEFPDKEFTPYWCARNDDTDRALRRQVFGETP